MPRTYKRRRRTISRKTMYIKKSPFQRRRSQVKWRKKHQPLVSQKVRFEKRKMIGTETVWAKGGFDDVHKTIFSRF